MFFLVMSQRIAYLHEAIEPKVVHRDIKASNILIDENFNAKVSDFGLAKLMEVGKTHVTTRVMGTFGYSLFNILVRAFSFGVVLSIFFFQVCGSRVREYWTFE